MREQSQSSRPRVSAAVLRDNQSLVLMVQHQRRDGTTYWQLPGGGVLTDETLHDAVVRELREETGLEGQVIRELFTIPYRYGSSTTFLVAVAADASPVLGYDPEEVDLAHRKLISVAWKTVSAMQQNPEIAELIRVLPVML